MSGYDATFVALAEDIKGRWLTADKAGARIVKGTGAASLVLQLSAWS
jgi:predicted nucleic acid-binding protein